LDAAQSEGLRSSGSKAKFAAIRRGDAPRLVAGEQPLCKHLRKWQGSRAGTKAQKTPCGNSNIPPALQSRETLPEGWPFLSMDSDQIGAVKVS